jgi:hypothetical protein
MLANGMYLGVSRKGAALADMHTNYVKTSIVGSVAKQCTPSSIQTALIFAWCCVYVNRGLLVTLRSNRAVSQTFTVLSSEDETKNT